MNHFKRFGNKIRNIFFMLLAQAFGIGGIFEIECVGSDGAVKWVERGHNLIPTAGLNHILDVILHGTAQITTWYVGLKGTGTPALTDTLASHATWLEINPYTGNRLEYVEAAASNGSTTNSANRAAFAITAALTVYGAFLCSAASGTSGTLLAANDFSTARAVESGDTLNVTYTITAANS